MCVVYSLRLPPDFSYNLNDSRTQNISVREDKVHLDYDDIHFIYIRNMNKMSQQ